MMRIYDIQGQLLLEVPVTPACEKVEELMGSDHVRLSWRSDLHDPLPAGAYIEWEGERYSLLDEYRPVQKTEFEWAYEPEFQSSIMEWKKIPFFMYTTDASGEVIHREIDWSLTGGPDLFLQRIHAALLHETGQDYSLTTDATGSKTLSFSSTDIYSALSAIADAFETEWWVDKDSQTLHLSKAYREGEAKLLEVGTNIGVARINGESTGYFNRFYVFGSTRNIVQNYSGANVNNLVNKRLTLDPAKYPDGYYEPYGSQPRTFSKILLFDDIYPAATNLHVYDLKVRIAFVLDKSTGQRIQVGTDSEGRPIYDVFATWFFKLGVRHEDGTYTQFLLNDWNYSEDPDKQGGVNPGRQGMLIPGLPLSVSFLSGSLRGREFALRYYRDAVTLHNQADSDGNPSSTTVEVDAGSFEIQYVEEGSYIIPDYASLIPREDDKAVLFNIRMPDIYLEDAYSRLEEAMLREVQQKYLEDRLQYSFSSNPVAFHEDDPALKIGSRVDFVNAGRTLQTRVVSLVTKLDYPIRQTITVGNSLVKGTIAQLQEEASSANRNIEVIAALSDSTTTLLNAYTRAQQSMVENMRAFKDMFELDSSSVPGKILIRAKYDGLYSDGSLSAGGVGPSGGGGGGSDILVLGYSSLGGQFVPDSELETFNAYTVNRIHERLSAVEQGSQGVIGRSEIAVGETTNNIDYRYATKDIVVTIYDESGQQVLADTHIARSGNRYGISASLAEPATEKYTIITYGV